MGTVEKFCARILIAPVPVQKTTLWLTEQNEAGYTYFVVFLSYVMNFAAGIEFTTSYLMLIHDKP